MRTEEILIKPGKLQPQLAKLGIELDQRMQHVLDQTVHKVDDSQVFLGLLRLNAISARYFDIRRVISAQEFFSLDDPPRTPHPPGSSHTILARVVQRAIKEATDPRTLGARDFLAALIKEGMEQGDSYRTRPFTVDMLSIAFGGAVTTHLAELPVVKDFLGALEVVPHGEEDFQYVLTFQGNKVVFRVVSILGDYLQRSDARLVVPQRAFLTHFKKHFSLFTEDEIEELEALINAPTTPELELQRFFERHSHFFRRWDYREVHPQVYLTRGPDELIPDFILTNRAAQRAAIVDLKLPGAKLIRRQDNRDRFAAAVSEARAQLLRYRDWFRLQENRALLKAQVGMEIYEPHLAVIIGRSSEFLDEVDRQRLIDDQRDIEIVTYDDIASFAKERLMFIGDQ